MLNTNSNTNSKTSLKPKGKPKVYYVRKLSGLCWICKKKLKKGQTRKRNHSYCSPKCHAVILKEQKQRVLDHNKSIRKYDEGKKIEKKQRRPCLKCDKIFWSQHKQNRVCAYCKGKADYYDGENIAYKFTGRR